MEDRFGIQTFKCNQEVVKRSNLIVIAVKPHIVEPVLKEIKDIITDDQLIMTVAAGNTISNMESILGKRRISRLAVNTPAFV